MGGLARSPTRRRLVEPSPNTGGEGTSTQEEGEEQEQGQEQEQDEVVIDQGIDKEEEVYSVEKRYRELISYINNDLDTSKKLKKANREELESKVTAWAFAQAELVGQIKRLERENKSLKKELENRTVNPTPISFAEIVKQDKHINKTSIAQKTQTKHTLFITSKDKKESIKTIQQKFTKNIDPVREGIRIRNLRTANNTLIVETEAIEDIEKITNNKKLATDLKMEPVKKRKPLMILYDLQTEWEEEEIKRAIYEQNLKDKMDREEFNNGFNLKFKTGPREKRTVHQVAEVDAKIRRILVRQERIFIGFHAIRIKDYQVVARCLKCQDLGHVAKHCKNEQQICGHCGQEHKKEDCPNKQKEPTCIPCQKRNKKCKERGNNCQTYKIMLERLVAKIDYGQ